jgi:hypothetical protein
MPEPQPSPGRAGVPRQDLLSAVVSSFLAAGAVYVASGFLLQVEALAGVPYQTAIRIGLAVVAALMTVTVLYGDLRDKARARAATAQVDEELKNRAQGQDAGTVAGVSTSDVAATVSGNPVKDTHLERLVEQRKQQLLLDKNTLRPELSYLVDNWQPLPRDVKRGLNRFYLSYLIAYNRGLLTTEPIVSGNQLAKWLVLSERWPQLGRALATWPQRIEVLERDAGMRPAPGERDPFKGMLGTLAPLYLDDEELRRFITSEPQLSAVLPRLVHYGAAQAVQQTAAAVQQVAAVKPETAAPTNAAAS